MGMFMIWNLVKDFLIVSFAVWIVYLSGRKQRKENGIHISKSKFVVVYFMAVVLSVAVGAIFRYFFN